MTVLLYDARGEPLLVDDDFDPEAPQPGVSCQGCGCTDEDGCPPDGCFWVAPGWCSRCAIAAEDLPS
jgi:hypothetical protein